MGISVSNIISASVVSAGSAERYSQLDPQLAQNAPQSNISIENAQSVERSSSNSSFLQSVLATRPGGHGIGS